MPKRSVNQPETLVSTRQAQRWCLSDLIDFQYFVQADHARLQAMDISASGLAERDRQIYQSRIQDKCSASAHTPEHRRSALRLWLEARRAATPSTEQAALPGTAFAHGRRLVTTGLGLLGVLLGLSVAAALLHYDGRQPVNVAWFVFILVGLQLGLATITLATWGLRKTRLARGMVEDFAFLGQFIRAFFIRATAILQRQRRWHWAQAELAQSEARLGRLATQTVLYGPVGIWPVLLAGQVFGIGFNLGVIASTLSLEWFTDLAFGWGSALDVAPPTVYELARGIAWPWRWLWGEGVGYPSLPEVAGSRIILKDPLAWQTAADLRAWRWFLVLAVLTYGLLPRLLLLSLSLWQQRRALAKLPFTHADTLALYARLVTPVVATQEATGGSGPAMYIPERLEPVTTGRSAPGPAAQPAASLGSLAAIDIAADACLLLLHVDVADVLPAAAHRRLQALLLQHTGWRVGHSATVGGGRAMNSQAIDLVANSHWQAPPPRLVIVWDGAQPPITETLRLLRELRSRAGTEAPLIVLLASEPTPAEPLPPLSAFEFQDWRRKLEQLQDPYLRVVPLAGAAEEAAS